MSFAVSRRTDAAAAAAADALLLLPCAEAVHVSIHNGISIQICRRFLRGEQGKKRPKKTSRFFGFVFLGNRKTVKSVFGCEKRKKPTEKSDLRFSVHNLGCMTHDCEKPGTRYAFILIFGGAAVACSFFFFWNVETVAALVGPAAIPSFHTSDKSQSTGY